MRLIRFEYPSYPTENDFNRFFGALFPADTRQGNLFGASRSAASADSPAINLYEDTSNYYAKLELPGVKKESIQVKLEGDALSVTAQRVEKHPDGESSTDFSRAFPVPENVDTTKLQATYENGELTLTLPKREESKPRRITVT